MDYTITDAGMALLIRAMTGDTIKFTKIAIGDNDNLNVNVEPANIKSLTGLINPLYETTFDSISVEDGYAKLTWSLDTATLQGLEQFGKIFFWSETGIFAENPDGGNDILYAYATVADIIMDTKQLIPSATIDFSTYIGQEISVYIGEVEDVSAEIAKNLPYVPREEFESHVNERNPHGTTWQDVGCSLETLGIRTYQGTAIASSKYYSEKSFYIPFSSIPENALLFFSYDTEYSGITVTSGTPGVVIEKGTYATGQGSPDEGWKITAKMYNFTGPITVNILALVVAGG